jgi:hypothetical protein
MQKSTTQTPTLPETKQEYANTSHEVIAKKSKPVFTIMSNPQSLRITGSEQNSARSSSAVILAAGEYGAASHMGNNNSEDDSV